MKKITTKKLTKTDLRKLTIPMESFLSFPQSQGHHAIDFELRDESGGIWPVGIRTRKKGHKKPVLSRGWRKFVLEKKLGVDDKVRFFMGFDHAGTAQYMIKVEKPIKRANPADALVHGTEEATGNANYMNNEEKSAMFPNHGFVEATGEENTPTPISEVTILPTGEAHHETEDKGAIKLFGVTLVNISNASLGI